MFSYSKILWANARFNTLLLIDNFSVIAFACSYKSLVLDVFVNPFGSSIDVLVHLRNDSVKNIFIKLIGQFVVQSIASGVDSSLRSGKSIEWFLRP